MTFPTAEMDAIASKFDGLYGVLFSKTSGPEQLTSTLPATDTRPPASARSR